MKDEGFKSLIEQYNQRIRSCELMASERAATYVQTAKDEDRAMSKQYLREASIWNEAKNMFSKQYQAGN